MAAHVCLKTISWADDVFNLFCYALLCVHFSFAIIFKRKRKLVALLFLSNRCIITRNVL